MRSIIKPKLSSEAKEVQHGTLMNHFGAYCSICETPVYDVVKLWHSQEFRIVPDPAPASSWPYLLLLCPLCELYLNTKKPSAPDNMLLPHQQHINIITDKSDFNYVLKPIELNTVVDSKPRTFKKELVIINANNEPAKQTLDYFGLNNLYADPNDTLFLEIEQYDYVADRRILMRTALWKKAEEAARQLTAVQKDQPTLEYHIHMHIQHLSRVAGYWSVWVTVFWQHFRDMDLLDKLFWPSGEGFHGYPGTSRHYFGE